MIVGYNISPLPFYDSVAEQFENHPCAFGVNYPLLCGVNEPLNFLFYTDDAPDECYISGITLVRVGHSSINVISEFEAKGLFLQDANAPSGGVSCIGFRPRVNFTYQYPALGLYYYIINVTHAKTEVTNTYYSEMFCVTDNLQDAIKITYTSPVNFNTPFGDIPFSNTAVGAFSFKVWLNALIGKPDYTFEEVETVRTGYPFLERCTSKKTYQFTVIVPEYLCDALRLIKLCPDVVIEHKSKTYNPISFDMSVNWEEQGDLASLRASFDTDNIITAVGGYQS